MATYKNRMGGRGKKQGRKGKNTNTPRTRKYHQRRRKRRDSKKRLEARLRTPLTPQYLSHWNSWDNENALSEKQKRKKKKTELKYRRRYLNSPESEQIFGPVGELAEFARSQRELHP